MKSIIIVGGGVSGLSAGIVGILNGYRVTILEKHSILGGNLTGWNREGHHIDNCIHWLTGTNPKSATFSRWQTVRAFESDDVILKDSFYTTFDESGNKISLYADLEKTKNEMLCIAPEDSEEIISFINCVKRVKILLGLSEKDNDIFEKLKGIKQLYKYYSLSLGDLAGRFKHPLLKSVMTGFIPEPFASLGLIFSYATFSSGNGGVIKGGSVKVASNMLTRFKSLGGIVYTNAEVESTAIKDKNITKIILTDGRELSGDYYLLCTDIQTAYDKILNIKKPKILSKRLNSKELLKFSSIQTAISFNGINLPFENECVIPVSQEFKGIIGADNLVLREFSYQKNFAPVGKTVLQTLTLLSEEQSIRWINLYNDKFAYSSKKQEFAKTVIKIIEGYFSEFKGNLRVIDVWTPKTYNRYFGEKIGAFMSYILPPKTIPISLSNRVKGIKNCVIASQWLSYVGGLPTALNSGFDGIKTINKLEKLQSKKIFFAKKVQQKSS